jgi:integrase/recombinase XerD
MGALRDRLVSEMKLRGFSQRTIEIYTYAVKRFAVHFNKSPLAVSPEECRSYFLSLQERGISVSGARIVYAALKFLFSSQERLDVLSLVPIPRPRRGLPEIMSRSEVQILFEHCSHKRYKALFSLIYSSGLRISEALALRVEDIDFERRVIRVRSGKGGRDRLTIIGEKAIETLRSYMAVYQPVGLTFYSPADPSRACNVRAVQGFFRSVVKRARLAPRYHVHTLRHSFATHLMEDGVNLFYVMRLLGHSSLSSTMVYLHMRSPASLDIRSPIDSPEFDLDRPPRAPGGQYLLSIGS